MSVISRRVGSGRVLMMSATAPRNTLVKRSAVPLPDNSCEGCRFCLWRVNFGGKLPGWFRVVCRSLRDHKKAVRYGAQNASISRLFLRRPALLGLRLVLGGGGVWHLQMLSRCVPPLGRGVSRLVGPRTPPDSIPKRSMQWFGFRLLYTFPTRHTRRCH